MSTEPARVRCPRCGGRGYHPTNVVGYEERCDQCTGTGTALVPASHYRHPANSSPPQSLLVSTGSRCGDPGPAVESPPAGDGPLNPAQSASSRPMGPATQTPAAVVSPGGGGRRDPSTSA